MRFVLTNLAVLAMASLALTQPAPKRMDALAQVRSKMAEYFVGSGRPGIPPRSKWTPQDEGQLSVLLDTELEEAKGSLNGPKVLAALDCLNDLGVQPARNTDLRAQVLWMEGSFAEAQKSAKGTPISDLINALEIGRDHTPSAGSASTEFIIRRNGYAIVRTYLSWPPFRAFVLKSEVTRILNGGTYLLTGDLPDGFEQSWLQGASGPEERWDAEWHSTWERRDIKQISGLLRSIDSYRRDGLSNDQKGALRLLQTSDWGLPYLWAKGSSEDNPRGIFNQEFVARVKAARLLQGGHFAEAELALEQSAANPRDRYELSWVREQIGTEEALKRLLSQRSALFEDPRLPGWSVEQVTRRLTSAQNKVDQFSAARAAAVAEASRQAEAARQAGLARQAAVRRQEEAHRKAVRDEAAKQASIRQEAADREAAIDQEAQANGWIRLSPQALIQAYRTNEVDADQNYRGRTVRMDCRVKAISKDFLDDPYLLISTGYDFQDIHASFDRSRNRELARLRPGMRVTLVGRVTGMMVTTVFLEDCILIQ